MKFVVILVAAGLAACAYSPAERPTAFIGLLAEMPYRTPSGKTSTSAVLELAEPLLVPGVPEGASQMELILSEELTATWRRLLGQRVRVTCVPMQAALWGYPHPSCFVKEVVIVP